MIPQMSPILWLMLYFYTIILMFFFLILLYYYMNFLNLFGNFNKLINLNYIFKW